MKLDDIGEPLFKNPDHRNLKISKINYDAESKELFINKSLYFRQVEKEIWQYTIGGYKVLETYLKNHKNEDINFHYFQKIIQSLHQSLKIQKEISKIDIDI